MDVGTVRVGVAASDPAGIFAVPVETVARGAGDLARIVALATERHAVEVVVGLPRSMSGAEGKAARSVREFAVGLARRLAPVPLRLVDERLSTAAALREQRASGVSQRRGRSSVDQAAAVIILQSALDTERATGTPPGETLQVGA